MLIGFMRNLLQPTKMARLTTMLCKYYGMDLIYIRPRDIDMNTNKVQGKMLVNDEWLTVQTDLPEFIDISPYCFKHKEIMNYLRGKVILSDTGLNLLGKEKLQQVLKEDRNFSKYVIPTKSADNIENIYELLKKFSTVVMKPIGGEKGKGVYILRKDEKTFTLGHKKEERKLNEKEFEKFYNDNIKNSRYIVQKYIKSRTKNGDPFDCRLHVEKNGEGKWVLAKKYIRIGIGQKVISNVNQGGGIADTKAFLMANFGDDWARINKKLNQLAVTLPYKIEKMRNTSMMTLGLDVGIDLDGELYIFESNGAPLTTSIRAEVAMLRTKYYKFVLTQQNKL
ncbi:YheC/YheD family protein [Virgibacillus halodenitrificans]|uniref:YheC/YheD family protein n=1 Tax=Virgibacillus halodenitrificans TaxID=1482 RepID=UPI00031258F3|nr:YheC/YheD family protein [Virgibacillus halodenitrificans]